MSKRTLWSGVFVIVGLLAMLVGAIDPLEGSFVILPGIAVVAVSEVAGQKPIPDAPDLGTCPDRGWCWCNGGVHCLGRHRRSFGTFAGGACSFCPIPWVGSSALLRAILETDRVVQNVPLAGV